MNSGFTSVSRAAWLLIFLTAGVATAPASGRALNAADFPSLQDAVNALPPEGGLVDLPPGIYELTSPLRIRHGDITLRGSGASSVVQNNNEKGAPAIVINSGEADPKKKDRQKPLWRVLLTDFRILGNPKSGHGIHAVDANELHLRSLTISENGGDGILMERCFENARVADCMITYNTKTGLNLNVNNHDTIVSANHFEENHDGIRSADGFNLTMTGNNLDDHLGSAVIIEKMMGSVITGNMIEQSAGWGLVLERDTYGITVASNIFTNNAAGGIDLADAHGCTISANTFSRTLQNSVVVRKDSSRVTIASNTFCNGFVGDGVVLGMKDEPRHGSGITLDGANRVNITGNTFSSVKPAAVVFQGDSGRMCVFSGNLVVDSEAEITPFTDSAVNGNIRVPGEE